MIPKIIYASRAGVVLDSNVHDGGGTDDTAILQSILDKAVDLGGLHLVLDGAALVSGLKIHSNTTIECLNSSCGLFLAPQSNTAILRNADIDLKEIKNRNITLIGGTYNHNCLHQEHHVTENMPVVFNMHGLMVDCFAVVALCFCGVENLVIKDVTIRNQRTYALLAANWFRVNIENVYIDLPDRQHYQNQDGMHFWGPGRFLNIKNVGGRTSDDFIALAPDENDDVSSIEDVNIDGVYLDDADQGIRMLCHAKGRLDRVIIKNVYGTYRSFGFFINPFFKSEHGGSYGNIIIDTVDLRSNGVDYDYTTPFLFRFGGRAESLTLRNIYHHNPGDNRSILDIGWQYWDDKVEITPDAESVIGRVIVDGLYIYETGPQSNDTAYIKTKKCHVKNITLRNIEIIKPANAPVSSCLFKTLERTDIENMAISGVVTDPITSLVSMEQGTIKNLKISDVVADSKCGPLVEVKNGSLGKLITHDNGGVKELIVRDKGR
jgi:hypothetical protein